MLDETLESKNQLLMNNVLFPITLGSPVTCLFWLVLKCAYHYQASAVAGLVATAGAKTRAPLSCAGVSY